MEKSHAAYAEAKNLRRQRREMRSASLADESINAQRSAFLIEMYRQTSTHLGRHITGVWQCVGVVGGALLVFALDRSKPLNDYACALSILMCGWLAATSLDASHWFNRNISIISNIERVFLADDDIQKVHHYFATHRPPGKMAEHFAIQIFLGGAVGLLILIYHFTQRVLPGFGLPFQHFDPVRGLPYIFFGLIIWFCIYQRDRFKKAEFKQQKLSPGRAVLSKKDGLNSFSDEARPFHGRN